MILSISTFKKGMKKYSLINLLLVLMVLALMLPVAVSCEVKEDEYEYVVQVWQPSASGEPEELLAYGVAVNDGNHVLTVLDYEEYTPGKLLVVSPEYGQFQADIQAIDYRTSATLLRMEDASLPTAEIGNTSVSILGEVTKEGKRYADKPGAAITDEDGRVIGIVGRYWSKLIVVIGGPGLLQPKPGTIDISSAMELLTDSTYSNGPAIVHLLTHSGIQDVNSSKLESGTPDDFKAALMGLLDKLVEPAPLDELSLYSSGFSRIGQTEEGVTILMVSFTYPVELHDTTGALIANARWVGIQWDRNDGKPNRLIYGSIPYIIDGSYIIEGNINNLIRIIEPALLK
jgi:hypothetical protein